MPRRLLGIVLSFCLFLALLGVLYLNRYLYLRQLLYHSQLQVYAQHFRLRRRRARFSENFRRLWVWAARFSSVWEDVCLALQPATVIDWERRRFKDYWTSIVEAGRKPGRPEISREEIDLIKKMATENPAWGPKRIQGEMKDLGFPRHIGTIRKHMPKRDPDPTRRLRWRKFLKLNMPRIAAMDFFLIPRAGKRLPLVGFFVIAHDRRRLLHIYVTEHPTADWLRQQLLLAFGDDSRLRFLIQDNDKLFQPIQKFIRAMQVRPIHTKYRSPWMNGIAERFVRIVREELLNFVIAHDEVHLRTLLLEYKEYYNADRTHSTLDMDSPGGRTPQLKPPNSRVVRMPRMRGLHSRYEWQEAA